MENELISVIVPVYNVEPFLRRCIDSICGQSYQNLEIILVDDGSTDGSGNICDEYKNRDERVKVIHKENGGLSDARNRGMEVATGAYLAFVDSDDWVEEGYAEELHHIMENSDSDIAVCSFYRDTDSSSREYFGHMSGKFFQYDRDEALRHLLAEDGCTNHMWNKLYRKAVLEDIRFPVGHSWEDLAVQWKIFMNAERISFFYKPLYHYYTNPGGICARADTEQYFCFFAFVRDRYDALKHIQPLSAYCQYSLVKGYRMEVAHLGRAGSGEMARIKQHRDFIRGEVERKDVYPLMRWGQKIMYEISLISPRTAYRIYRWQDIYRRM